MADPRTPANLDAVDAYDRIAQSFAPIQAARRAYCDAIDGLVLANLPEGAESLLDVGSGNGKRAEAIAAHAGISDLVLVEPSAGMRALMRTEREVWARRVEELVATRNFDAITCLWNVLGHIGSPENRLRSLRNMRALLSPKGRLFLDVQNRYNARHYGVPSTAGRALYDLVRPSPSNGDVTVRWPAGEGFVTAYGHVFTPKEIRSLLAEAGLTVQKSLIVDYATGQQRTFAWQGSMFFVLTR